MKFGKMKIKKDTLTVPPDIRTLAKAILAMARAAEAEGVNTALEQCLVQMLMLGLRHAEWMEPKLLEQLKASAAWGCITFRPMPEQPKEGEGFAE
jgi:hypothetical protein